MLRKRPTESTNKSAFRFRGASGYRDDRLSDFQLRNDVSPRSKADTRHIIQPPSAHFQRQGSKFIIIIVRMYEQRYVQVRWY